MVELSGVSNTFERNLVLKSEEYVHSPAGSCRKPAVVISNHVLSKRDLRLLTLKTGKGLPSTSYLKPSHHVTRNADQEHGSWTYGVTESTTISATGETKKKLLITSELCMKYARKLLMIRPRSYVPRMLAFLHQADGKLYLSLHAGLGSPNNLYQITNRKSNSTRC